MWVTGVVTLLKLLWLFFSAQRERNLTKKRLKKEALNEVVAGIKEHDPSRITRGFDRANRV